MSLMRGTFGALLIAALSATAAAPSAAQASQADQSLSAVLDKATAYVATYLQTLSSVVGEERYEQELTWKVPTHTTWKGAVGAASQNVRLVLVSDYLLVQIPCSAERTPFRDVYSVDGTPVRERSERLLKLLQEPSATASSAALQIRDESRRYHLGDQTSDINVPTFALEILTAAVRPGFTFKRAGRDRVDGKEVAQIAYAESGSSTLVQGLDGVGVPASGSFSVDPTTGAVLRSVMETKPQGMRTRIIVKYKFDAKLGMLAPAEMDERRELSDQVVTGRSTYFNFRRFRVDTSFGIK